MEFDLSLIETEGNGGDLQKANNDVVVVYGIQNVPYLALCGGNLEQSTDDNVVKEQSLDWWGNSLLYPDNKLLQMNSKTERTLNSVPLNSSGRIQIEDAVKEDMGVLSAFGKVTVNVVIVSDDRVDITIRIEEDPETIKILVINFKKNSDGDYFLFDFNDDFFL